MCDRRSDGLSWPAPRGRRMAQRLPVEGEPLFGARNAALRWLRRKRPHDGRRKAGCASALQPCVKLREHHVGRSVRLMACGASFGGHRGGAFFVRRRVMAEIVITPIEGGRYCLGRKDARSLAAKPDGDGQRDADGVSTGRRATTRRRHRLSDGDVREGGWRLLTAGDWSLRAISHGLPSRSQPPYDAPPWNRSGPF